MDSPRCQRALRLLQERLDGEISPDGGTWLEGHLRACPPCRTAEKELTALDAMARAEPLEDPPPEWTASLMDRFERTRQRPRQTRSPRRAYVPLWKTVATALACACLLYVLPGAPFLDSYRTAATKGEPLLTRLDAALGRGLSLVEEAVPEPTGHELGIVEWAFGQAHVLQAGLERWAPPTPSFAVSLEFTRSAWGQALAGLLLLAAVAVDLTLLGSRKGTLTRERT